MTTAMATNSAMAGEAQADGERSLRLYRQQLLRELAEVDRRLGSGITPDR